MREILDKVTARQDAEALANLLHEAGYTIVPQKAFPLDAWHEDIGDVLWWKMPIDEPPYVGSPLDTRWPGYHTHWTPLSVPHNQFATDMKTKGT